MSWENLISKKALRCIKNIINDLVSADQLEKKLVDKLKSELLGKIEDFTNFYCREYPIVPTKYLAEELDQAANSIEEFNVKPLKKRLEYMNRLTDDTSDESEYYYPYPNLIEDIDYVSKRLIYITALMSELRGLSISLYEISVLEEPKEED